MTEIVWPAVDHDKIERIIAVGLCRRHEHARRIKPSQGDGGLDVLVPIPGGSQLRVDNYQVKRFTQDLNASRRKQIKKSLKSAIKTHHGNDFGYEISKWYLAMPMDLSREEEKWLFDLAVELEAPFPVESFGLTSIEELLVDAPNIREYYLGDGMERLREVMAQMASLNDLTHLAADPTEIEPADATDPLTELHRRINDVDPHFRYDFETTHDHPTVSPVPGLIASVISQTSSNAPYVTWHIFTRYDSALDDRSIPGGYTVHPDRMTDEQRNAWGRWYDFGVPVEVHGNAIADFTIDLPGGLGTPPVDGQPTNEPTDDESSDDAESPSSVGVDAADAGEAGTVSPEATFRVGPAVGEFDDEPTTRSLWVIEDDTGTEVARRLLSFRLAGQGLGGGEYRLGTDEHNYFSVELFMKPSSTTHGSMKINIRLNGPQFIDEPVQRLLPMLRFVCAWGDGNSLRFFDEFELNTVDQATPLTGTPPVHPVLLAAVEDLVRISSATRQVIGLPRNINGLIERGGDLLRIVADTVSGLEPEIGVEAELWLDDTPEAFEYLATTAAAGGLIVPWSIPFPLLGDDYAFEFSLEFIHPVTVERVDPPASRPAGPARGHGAARVVSDTPVRGRLRWPHATP